MELDYQTSLQISKIVGRFLLDDIGILFIYLLSGMSIGIALAYLLYRFIKAKRLFKREPASKIRHISLYIFRTTFYLSVVGLSSTIGLVVGSNKIVDKEVTNLVDEGISYFKTNYFSNFTTLESAFQITDVVYSAGYDVNQANHKVSEAMVDMISEEYGLGFLGSYLLISPKNEMVEQLEEVEKAMVMFLVFHGLDHIGAGELIEPEDVDKAFYAWLNNDSSEGLGSMNSFLSTQIIVQLKPLVFGIWLPFVVLFSIFILANAVETGLFLYRKNKDNTLASSTAPKEE